MSSTDPYVLIDKALTDREREVILTWFTAVNPNLHGALVADLLDMAVDHDEFLATREPFAESADYDLLAAEFPGQGLLLAGCTVAAVVLIGATIDSAHHQPVPAVMYAVVHGLATRAVRAGASTPAT